MLLAKMYAITSDYCKNYLARLNIKAVLSFHFWPKASELQLQPMAFRLLLFESENNYPIKPMGRVKKQL